MSSVPLPADRSRADALYDSALVWDNVWPVDLKGRFSVGNDWAKLERFHRAGVGVLGVTLAGDEENVSQAIALVAGARAFLRANQDRYVFVRHVDDVLRAHAQRRLAIVLQFEGTNCFERNPELVDVYYALGVRQTILAFNNQNAVGGGCAEPDSGLTALGRRMVAELQRVGMLVDLSHVGKRTSLDALELATRPMVFTHSNANAVAQNFRNLDDDQVKACAATGGLVGVSGASLYLGDADCRTETIFRHVDHYVQLVGPAHVGIGLDVVYDAGSVNEYLRGRPDEWPLARDPAWPGFRYAMPEQLRELTALMLDAGYGEDAVRGILGGNYVRVCRAAWGEPTRAAA